MASPKMLITVYGVTGAQGGSVARSLIQNPVFSVRGTTRNPNSPAAQAVAADGIEVVKADGFDPESMRAAFTGAWGAFINTDSNDESVGDGTLELSQGKSIIDAALDAGVQHLVFSSLPSAIEKTGIAVRNFDIKAELEKYARSRPFKTSSFIYAGWYYENNLKPRMAAFRGGFPQLADEEGYINLKFPHWGDDEGASYIGIEDDFGDIVHGMLVDPEAVNGKVVHGASQELRYPEYVSIFSEVTGRKARYIEIPFEEVPTFGIRPWEELVKMFRFIQKLGGREMGEPLNLKTPLELKNKARRASGKPEAGLTTWREWLEKNKERIFAEDTGLVRKSQHGAFF